MKRGLILIFLLFSSCNLGLQRPLETPPPEIEVEEYDIYSALIHQNPIGYNLGAYIVIREQTIADIETFESTLENVHRLPSSLIDSYRLRNATSYILEPKLDVEQQYVLMPEEVFEQILLRKNARWADFKARYPGVSGLIIFSRVGFNAKGDKALATFGFRCDDLCGAGGLYLLVKEDGNWNIQEELMVWES